MRGRLQLRLDTYNQALASGSRTRAVPLRATARALAAEPHAEPNPEPHVGNCLGTDGPSAEKHAGSIWRRAPRLNVRNGFRV